jgi:hypothetical protein
MYIGFRPPYVDNPVIVDPEKWRGRTYKDILDNEYAWNANSIKDLQNELRLGRHDAICNQEPVIEKSISYPDLQTEYEEVRQCNTNGGTVRDMTFAKLFSWAMISFVTYLYC